MIQDGSAEINELLQEARRLRFEDPDEARRLSAQAVDAGRHLDEKRSELITALKLLGQIERDSGDLIPALRSYEEAAAICRGRGDRLALAHTVRHLGDIHREAGRNDLAEPLYQEALSIYRTDDDTNILDLANAVRPMAILKETQGEMEEAKRLFAEARDLYEASKIAEGVTEMSRRLQLINNKTEK